MLAVAYLWKAGKPQRRQSGMRAIRSGGGAGGKAEPRPGLRERYYSGAAWETATTGAVWASAMARMAIFSQIYKG